MFRWCSLSSYYREEERIKPQSVENSNRHFVFPCPILGLETLSHLSTAVEARTMKKSAHLVL